MTESCTKKTDWVANKKQFATKWGVPTVIILLTGMIPLPLEVVSVTWMISLSWMGIACLRNARACGRMHCFFSGPYFLGTAVLAFGIGMQWIPSLTIGELGWFLLIGTPLICVLPEVIWGTYKTKSTEESTNGQV